MDFDLSEDEQILKGVAERFIGDRYGVDRRRAYLSLPQGFSPENWALLAELGLIAATFNTDSGGLGLGPVGLVTVMKVLGQGLVVEPLVESAVIAGGLFADIAPHKIKARWLEDLVTGGKRLALAHRERAARKNLAWVTMTARTNGSGFTLSGEKSLVPAGEGADGYLVTARVEGTDAFSMFLVNAGAQGLTSHPWRLVDGSSAVSLTFENVHVDADHHLGGGLMQLEHHMTRAALLKSAEALGIMERMQTDTLEHLRTRRQFGAALADFQALQHRMVHQYAILEQAHALLNLAAMTPEADRAAWTRAVQGARAYIAENSIGFGHEMIQMHGGMGVTDELAIGQGHKRLLMLSRWPESAEAALDRYAGVV